MKDQWFIYFLIIIGKRTLYPIKPSKAFKQNRQLSNENCEGAVFMMINKKLFILHVMHSFKCTEDPSRYSF